MRAKADASGTRFRPHVKSHNSPTIASLYREVGVTAITVSSVEMARRFADAGWDDITIAFPLNVRALPELRRLAAEVRLGLLVDSPDAADALARIEAPVDVWLDIDVGYGRTGIPWDDGTALSAVLEVAQRSNRHCIRGVLTHAGHAYPIPDVPTRLALWAEVADRRVPPGTPSPGRALRGRSRSPFLLQHPQLRGSPALRWRGRGPAWQLRSFFDMQQYALGSCTSADLALVVVCPVVCVYPGRGEIVVRVARSICRATRAWTGRWAEPWPAGRDEPGGMDLLPAAAGHVRGLSQEHGMIRCTSEVLNRVRVGDLVFVVPAHACLAANLIGIFVYLDEPADPFRS